MIFLKRAGGRRQPGCALLAALFLLCACRSAPEPIPEGTADRPPNIVFILADDLGYGDLGAYGQQRIRTPRLDRMAQEGTRFTQFYAGSTVCAPSRSVLMTGQHTGRTLVRGNARGGKGVPLRPEDTTVAEVLREAGYATGMFGKWGLGVEETTGAPHRQGFDAFLGYLDQVHAHFYHSDHLWEVEDGRLQRRPIDTTAYTHDLIAEAALRFIDDHRDRPFFLYVPFTIPHAELVVPEGALRVYQDAQGNSLFPETPYVGDHYASQPMPHAAYAAMVSYLDRDVGRILDRLERHGLTGNTLVFFTSDNGPHGAGGYDPTFFDGNGPLRGMKRDLYEGGIRVPMIVWGPGRVPAGATSDVVWAMWDVLPTLAALAGAAPPEGIDGLSFAPALSGGAPRQQHEYLYWEFYERGSAQAVRMGRWKAVRKPMHTGAIELYDLEQDLGETSDVAGAHPEVVAQIRAIMDEAHEPSPLWTARAR